MAWQELAPPGAVPGPGAGSGVTASLVSSQSLPQICSAEDGHAFTSALLQLYMAVTLQEAKQARKRHHPGEELLAGMWGNVEYSWVKPPPQGNGDEDLDAAHSPLL